MKTVRATIQDDLFEHASYFAKKRGLDSGNNSGVSTVIKMALKAYLNKYEPEFEREGGTSISKESFLRMIDNRQESASRGGSG